MSEEKNKGGRPTNAELAARGIIQTDLKQGLRLLKRGFAEAIRYMQEQSDNIENPIALRLKLKKELADMFVNYYKADVALKKELAKAEAEANPAREAEGEEGIVVDFA